MASFGAELVRASAGSGVVPRLVAERPEEWRLGPLTVAVDRRGGAQLRYARLAVARAPGVAAAVMQAWRRALDRLAAGSLTPDEFLPRLAAHYQALAAAAGERVDLVDLRDRVTRERRGYSRAQFAWDLARLRREQRLEHEGRRVDLGVVTGVAPRSRMVWIEDESGTGQYYRNFRFR